MKGWNEPGQRTWTVKAFFPKGLSWLHITLWSKSVQAKLVSSKRKSELGWTRLKSSRSTWKPRCSALNCLLLLFTSWGHYAPSCNCTFKTTVSHLRAPAGFTAWETQKAAPQSALITTWLHIKRKSQDIAIESQLEGGDRSGMLFKRWRSTVWSQVNPHHSGNVWMQLRYPIASWGGGGGGAPAGIRLCQSNKTDPTCFTSLLLTWGNISTALWIWSGLVKGVS